MAGKGTYGAYKNARGVGTQVADTLNRIEQSGFQYREEERKRKQEKAKRIEKAAETYGVAKEMMTYDKSGVQSLDKPMYKYFQNASQEVNDLTERIMEDENDTDAVLRLKSIMSSAKQMKAFATRYRDYMQDFKAGIQPDGKYSKTLNKDIPLKINSALQQGKWSVFNDKNGDLQIVVDTDGDGEMDEDFFGINVAEFIQGNDLYAPAPAYREKDLRSDMLSNFGTFEKELSEDGSYVETTFKGFNPDKTDDLHRQIDKRLGTTPEEMTDEAKAILGDEYGVQDFNSIKPEEFNEFKQEVAQGVINAVDVKTSEKFDRAGKQADFRNRLAERRESRQQAEFDWRKDKDKRDNQEQSSEGVELRLDENNNPTRNETHPDAYEFSFKDDGIVQGNKVFTKTILKGDGKVALIGYKEVDAVRKGVDGENERYTKQVPMELSNQSEISALVRQKKKPGTDRNYTSLFDYAETLRQKVRAHEGQGELDTMPSLD